MHLFTDDPEYREGMKDKFFEAWAGELLFFGPTEYKKELAKFCSSSEGAKFKRCTDTSDAITEFLCMSLCDEFVGTAGSTVTFFVEAMNKRYSKPFTYQEIIGDWHVPSHPTYKFRENTKTIIKTLEGRLKDNMGVNITHAQANVLDFLTDHHLESMHGVLTYHLKKHGGSMAGSRLGELFLQDSHVARMNKERFKQCDADKVGNQHWLKALLKGKLRQWSAKSDEATDHVIMGPDATIMLVGKYSHSGSKRGGASSSSDNPGEKNRT